MFGGYLLGLMILTHFYYPIESLHRYDFLFLAAIGFQVFLLLFRFESLREGLVILIFHVVATVMELFKTHPDIGSWSYPEDYSFGIATVPLFTGFMYSAVGSYIARVWRIFDFRFNDYPPKGATIVLVALIYVNFFSHHFWVDIRWALLAWTGYMFWGVNVYFKILKKHRYMPLLLGWLLVAFFIWVAENIGTLTGTWIYPNQKAGWELVSLGKLVSWYLLMLLSFVLVSLTREVRAK